MKQMEERDERELIEKIAEPILDTLLDLQDSLDDPCPLQSMTIRLSCIDEDKEAVDFGIFGLDDSFISKLESYLQQELDAWNRPTLLH